MGPLLSTGWKRKPRGPDGKILAEPKKEPEVKEIEVQEVKSGEK